MMVVNLGSEKMEKLKEIWNMEVFSSSPNEVFSGFLLYFPNSKKTPSPVDGYQVDTSLEGLENLEKKDHWPTDRETGLAAKRDAIGTNS